MSKDREAHESLAAQGSAHAIRAANEQLAQRTADLLELPLSVLIQQRDEALRETDALRRQAERESAATIAEQDQFITYLMTDHEVKLLKLSEELKVAQLSLERLRAIAGSDGARQTSLDGSTDALPDVARLKDLLEAAYAEAEATRGDAARLQGELDDVVRSVDDVRIALREEIDAARDDAFRIQTQLDETNRLLEDTRDEARDQAFRFTEELAEQRRELDERVAEVRRLRERLAEPSEGPGNSLPPPPAAAELMDAVRSDNQLLRKQLIDAKRELSRLTRELELAQMRRVARPTPSAGRPAVSPDER